MAKKRDGKSARKVGRNARKPGTARKKFARLDLYRKARNVLKSCGEKFLVEVWTPERKKVEPEGQAMTVNRARDAALREK